MGCNIDRRGFLAGTAAAAVALAGGRARAASPPSLGFVYVGPVGDFGWSYQHELGRRAVQAKFGDKVKTHYVENVAEGPDSERVFRQLAASGDAMIFATSFGYMNPALRVAQQFPNVKFEIATGYKTLPNAAEYNARFYQGRAVCGTIAGAVSKKGFCGYVAPFPIPEVVMGVNAFTIAARKVNPNFRTKIIWVNTWFDPGKEADAAKSLIDQGADVIAQHTDSPAAMQTAQSRGVYAFGQDSDMRKFGPTAQLTAIINNWAPYYVERTQALLDGTWKTQSVWYGLKEGMVELAPFGPGVTPAAQQAADKVKQGIIDGTLYPFEGPVNDAKGALKVAAGTHPSDHDLLTMNWYVEGVQA
ncbi:MAG TPA: BMP family ABC transporter substrate-binding protein [Acetobacteraceae bacterium]|nr:BMP family ABC transporter substrate-binding protein [Acetobacteraceae bacterium]